MRLHAAMFNGQTVYYVRTDASDREFAEAEKLVFVPKLLGALDSSLYGDIYVFSGGTSGQTAIVSTAPGQNDFTPLLRISRVSWNGQPRVLQSVADVQREASAGTVSVEATETIVNYPFVKWADAGLPVDGRLENALDGGPLVSAPDLADMSVVFKLHQCYPESYYIITDTSAIPMTSMMKRRRRRQRRMALYRPAQPRRFTSSRMGSPDLPQWVFNQACSRQRPVSLRGAQCGNM